MDELIFGLLVFNLVYNPVDNIPLGLSLNTDSSISVEEYGVLTDVSVEILLDIYVDGDVYATEEIIRDYEINFAYVDRMEIDIYDIMLDNNNFYLEGDLVTYFTDYSKIEDNFVISVSLYEDYVFEDDFDFGSYTAVLYDIKYVDGFYFLGYELGYTEGYNRAEEETQGINNVIEWFSSVWDGLARILALEIAPNLTIGTIITIPIVIAVLFFGLRALIQ